MLEQQNARTALRIAINCCEITKGTKTFKKATSKDKTGYFRTKYNNQILSSDNKWSVQKVEEKPRPEYICIQHPRLKLCILSRHRIIAFSRCRYQAPHVFIVNFCQFCWSAVCYWWTDVRMFAHDGKDKNGVKLADYDHGNQVCEHCNTHGKL